MQQMTYISSSDSSIVIFDRTVLSISIECIRNNCYCKTFAYITCNCKLQSIIQFVYYFNTKL